MQGLSPARHETYARPEFFRSAEMTLKQELFLTIMHRKPADFRSRVPQNLEPKGTLGAWIVWELQYSHAIRGVYVPRIAKNRKYWI